MNEIPKKIKENPLLKDAIVLYNNLPATLKSSEILKYNKTKIKKNKRTEYIYQSLCFLIPQGIFLPGGASKIIFDYLYDDSIKMKGINYLVMGCGAGVEAVIAALKNTNIIYAIDIDPLSIKTTKYNYNKIINKKTISKFYPIISDLFNDMIDYPKIKFDLITFNPPAVSIKISNQKNIIRNTCVGADILNRFFFQIKEKQILSFDGKILITLSNTSDLKKIIYHAIRLEFIPKIVWSNNFKNLKMYLFEFSLNKAKNV